MGARCCGSQMKYPKRLPRRTLNAVHRFYAGASENPQALSRTERDLTKPERKRTIRRPVDGRPVEPTEHQVQCAVIQWWALMHGRYGLPPYSLFAIPNGGARDAITGARLKQEGVRRGVPDLMLARANSIYHGLYIELKIGSNKPSSEQEEFMRYLEHAGYRTVVHWDAESAIKTIEEYLA